MTNNVKDLTKALSEVLVNVFPKKAHLKKSVMHLDLSGDFTKPKKSKKSIIVILPQPLQGESTLLTGKAHFRLQD